MKPIKQTICDSQNANCFQACVASIFEVALNIIPNFQQGDPPDFYKTLCDWASLCNLIALEISIKYLDDPSDFKDCYIIATGPSPRNPEKYLHAVIYLNGKMVHDPHPSNDGIIGQLSYVTVFVIKDYSIYKIIKQLPTRPLNTAPAKQTRIN